VRENVPQDEVSILVHGDASRGADRMARDFAQAMWWLQEEAHPADWSWGSPTAGHERNQAMVDLGADVCLAFIQGESRGTRDCIKRARQAGIPVIVHYAEIDNEDDQA